MTHYLLPISDVHLEFEVYDTNGRVKYPKEYFCLPKRNTNQDTTLLLLGDIGVVGRKHTIFPFLETCSRQFKNVLYVPGNHEYYNGSMITVPDKVRTFINDEALANVHFLLNDTVELEGHRFIGSTLWTDYNKKNPSDILTAQFGMRDFEVIRTGTRSDPYMKCVSPYDMIVQHDNAVAYITSQLKRAINDEVPAVVLTHHLPSYRAVHEKFDGDQHNCCYASDLDMLICDYGPKYWFHGHTHESVDLKLFNTRIMCNPRGYAPADLNENFEPDWLIEL